MYCYHCGADVPDESSKCPSCGAVLCGQYGNKSCSRYVTVEITQKKVERFAYGLALVAAVLTVIYVAIAAVRYCKRVWMPSPRDVVAVSEIQPEDVWLSDSGVRFTAYPAQISPGQWAQLDAVGTPETEYYIGVQVGTRVMTSDRLLAQTSDRDGRLSWVWKVPKDAAPGIYSIHVRANDGTENLIDYAILDRGGNVYGSPSAHVLGPAPAAPEQSEPVAGNIPDQTPATDPGAVYITDTGEKYHREGCQYLDESQTTISLEDAQASGYEPCTVCNP